MINSSIKCKGKMKETEVIKECGMHTRTLITLIPDDMRSIEDFFKFAKISEKVEISLDNSLIMCGTVSNISGCIKYTGAAVTLEVMSDSAEADINKASRIFQSTQKSIQTVFDKLSNDKYRFVFRGDASSKTIEEVIIQNNETDFEFVSRIAKEYGCKVFVCADERGVCEIIVSESLSKTKQLDTEKVLMFNAEISKHRDILDIEYPEYMELGTTTALNGEDYVVVCSRAIRKDDNTRFFYKLERIKSKLDANIFPTELVSVGKARVTDNKDPKNFGRIQVEFLEMEDALGDSKIWIKYINTFTADSGGIIMIPDVNEYVEVLYQNNECFAYGCVREKELAEKVKSPDAKSILLFDRILCNKKDAVTYEAGEFFGELRDKEVYFKNDNCSIKMNSDNLTVKNKNSTIQIEGKKVLISINKNNCIEVSDKEILVKASGSKFKLDSSKAELKVSKFDVN